MRSGMHSDVADAERHRAEVHVGEIAVEQVGDDLELAGREHFFGNLAAGLEAGARQRDRGPWRAPASSRARRCVVGASMMKPRSAPATSIAASSTSASTSSSTRPEPSARRPSSSAASWRRSLTALACDRSVCGGAVAGQEHHVGAAGAAELHPIAVRQLVLGDRLAVDVGAVARALVAQDPVAVLLDDLGVLARHVAADQPQIALGAAADAEQRLCRWGRCAAEAVVDFQPGVSHARYWQNASIIAASAGHFPRHRRQRQAAAAIRPRNRAAADAGSRRRRLDPRSRRRRSASADDLQRREIRGIGGDFRAARSAFHTRRCSAIGAVIGCTPR